MYNNVNVNTTLKGLINTLNQIERIIILQARMFKILCQ
jgi:hypothetical protein